MRNRITKTMADKVAIKLLSDIFCKSKDLKNRIDDIVLSIIESTTPSDVKELRSRHPEYLRYMESCRITISKVHRWFKTPGAIYKETDDLQKIVESHSKFNELVDLISQRDELESNIGKIKHKIRSTLIDLRTYRRIKESYIEAYNVLIEIEASEKAKLPEFIAEVSDFNKSL